jgi:hypothetical protein
MYYICKVDGYSQAPSSAPVTSRLNTFSKHHFNLFLNKIYCLFVIFLINLLLKSKANLIIPQTDLPVLSNLKFSKQETPCLQKKKAIFTKKLACFFTQNIFLEHLG